MIAKVKGGYYILSNGLQSHFETKEFTCKCGCGINNMDQQQIDSLEVFRERIHAPLNVTPEGGCDCGGEGRNKTSAHFTDATHGCKATDCFSNKASIETLFFTAIKMDFKGVGLYISDKFFNFKFIHLDTILNTDRRPSGYIYWVRERNVGAKYKYFLDADKCFEYYKSILKGGETI